MSINNSKSKHRLFKVGPLSLQSDEVIALTKEIKSVCEKHSLSYNDTNAALRQTDQLIYDELLNKK